MADEYITVTTPKGPVRFPKSMSKDDIQAVLDQEFNPAQSNIEGKASRDIPGLTAGTGTDMDISKSILQGGRNVAEGLLAAPGMADDLERTVVDWLKSAGDTSPLVQSFGPKAGEILKTAGENWDAIANKVHANDIAFPNYSDVQWLEKEAGMPDQYQPQTPAGQTAYYGTVGGLGAAIGGGPAMGMAEGIASNPYAQLLGRSAIQGAGLVGGGGLLYGALQGKLPGPSGWEPFK